MPTLLSTTYLDDNRRLRPRDGSGLGATQLEGRTDLLYRRPTWSLEFKPSARFLRNTSQKFLDAEEYFLTVGGSKLFERDIFQFETNYARQLSATTEIDELGSISSAVPRRTQGLNGSWTHLFNEQLRSTVFGSTTAVRYDNAPGSPLVDYDYATVGTGLEYQLSAQTTWLVNGIVQYFETPELRSENFSFIYQFGIDHNFDETLNARILVGQNVAKSTVTQQQLALVSRNPFVIGVRDVTTTTRGSGQILEVNVTKRIGRNTFEATWNRAFNPSSLGSRQLLEEVSGRASRLLTPKLTVAARFDYRDQEQESVAGVSVQPRLRYVAGIQLIYRFDRHIRITADYRRSRLERLQTNDTADSNRVTLTLRYRGDPISDIGRKLFH